MAEMVRLYAVCGLKLRDAAGQVGLTTKACVRALERAGVVRRPGGTCYAPRKRVRPVNEAAFDDPDDPTVQYWAGVMMADGCVCDRRCGQPVISLGLQISDRGHVEAFRSFLGSGHAVCVRGPRVTVGPHGRLVRDTGEASVAVASARLAAALGRLGVVPRKTYTARARLVADSPDFWRGCVDGDGWVSIARQDGREYPRVGLQGTADLAQQFCDFVNTRFRGHDVRHSQGPDSAHLRVVVLAGYLSWKVIEALYGHGGVSLARKQVTATTILGRPELCPTETFSTSYAHVSDEGLRCLLEGPGGSSRKVADAIGVSTGAARALLCRRGLAVRKKRVGTRAGPLTKEEAVAALVRANGVRRAAARLVGVHEQTFHQAMTRFGLR